MSNATRHVVVIAVDHEESREFSAWLNAQGHTATVGDSTANYVDGDSTASDEDANEIMNNLWDAYCRSA